VMESKGPEKRESSPCSINESYGNKVCDAGTLQNTKTTYHQGVA